MKTVLCDDHRLFAEAFAAVLTRCGHGVAAITDTVVAGVNAAAEHDPDLAVFDICFPVSNGLAALSELLERSPRTAVVLLTGSADPRGAAQAIQLGARGYLRKDQDASTIVRSLERVHRGETVAAIRPNGAAHAFERQPDDVRRLASFLAPREREVLQDLVRGRSTDEIAARMHISRSTTRTHVQSLLSKLGVSSRLEVAALVADSGLLQDPSFASIHGPQLDRG